MRGVTANAETRRGVPGQAKDSVVASSSSQPAQALPKRMNSKMAGAQSINHLLNFSLPPRQSHGHQSLPRRSRKGGQAYGVWNKEKFVNAQYRFVMKPAGDYTVHFADPDIFFQWQDILQVIIPRKSALASAAERQDTLLAQDEGAVTCPICLSPPTAPRMTKCGHVFCYPCVLHYLSTSEHAKWNRCPICFDSINEKQLKSVKWYDEYSRDSNNAAAESSSSSSSSADVSGVSAKTGSLLSMRLMQRPQITTLALPRSDSWPSDVLPPHQAPFHFLPDVYRYARFMLATPEYLLSDLSRDLDELQAERKVLAPMNDDLSLEFVDVAETKVRRQMEKASALDTPELKEAIARAEQTKRDLEKRIEERGRRLLVQERQGLGSIPDEFLNSQRNPPKPNSTHRGQRARRNVNPPPPSSSTYFFYQAASGMPIFLHPLDIRILLSHFESYQGFPNTITVRVDASTEGSIDGDLRRRCKYLAHMPESADVVFVEADLSSVVSEDTLRAFETPLRARTSKRREKGKRDDRAKARAEFREREKHQLPPPSISSGQTVKAGYDRDLAEALAATSVDGQTYHTEDDVDEDTAPDSAGVVSPASPPALTQTGAWGSRSFASAAQPGASRSQPRRSDREMEDEWDVDVEWHESRGGGRKKRSNKLLVLGGGGRRY